MKAAITLAILLLPLSCRSGEALAQKTSSPESIAKALRTGAPAARTTIARRLGISGPSDPDWANCVGDLQISLDHPHLEQGMDTSVLRLECGYGLDLVLFGREPGAAWKELDTISLYDAYNNAKLEYQSLIRPGVQELVVQNAATASGTLYQAYFLVFRVLGGRFMTALAVLETAMEPHLGGTPRDEKSTITIEPATKSETGEITQVAHLMIGSRTFLVRSSYSWSGYLHAFAKDETDRVSHLK